MSMCKCTLHMKLPAVRKALSYSRRLEACTDNRDRNLNRSRETLAARVR